MSFVNEDDIITTCENLVANIFKETKGIDIKLPLLRMKYESSKTEEGYRYRYYTFNNQTQNNNLEYNGMNILFDSSESVSSYLTIEHK